MSNTLGLLLIGLFIGGIIGFVIFVEYMAKHHPDSKVGELCKGINEYLEKLPEDD
jgi:hypothetical protein